MRHKPYNENWLEKKLAVALEDHGKQSFHMSDQSKPGIPDRYVTGMNGLWIEVKQGATFDALVKGFDRQRAFMNKLYRAGDNTWVCALLQSKGERRLYLEPWSQWLLRETETINRGLEFDDPAFLNSPFMIEAAGDIEDAVHHQLEIMVRG